MRYWVSTAARETMQTALLGREDRLRRLSPGDRVAFYAPKKEKRFIALASVDDASPTRTITFVAAAETPIQPLIEELEFIPDKKRWGFPFRRGFFEIKEADYQKIAKAMGVE
jgi:EVE domain